MFQKQNVSTIRWRRLEQRAPSNERGSRAQKERKIYTQHDSQHTLDRQDRECELNWGERYKRNIVKRKNPTIKITLHANMRNEKLVGWAFAGNENWGWDWEVVGLAWEIERLSVKFSCKKAFLLMSFERSMNPCFSVIFTIMLWNYDRYHSQLMRYRKQKPRTSVFSVSWLTQSAEQ